MNKCCGKEPEVTEIGPDLIIIECAECGRRVMGAKSEIAIYNWNMRTRRKTDE